MKPTDGGIGAPAAPQGLAPAPRSSEGAGGRPGAHHARSQLCSQLHSPAWPDPAHLTCTRTGKREMPEPFRSTDLGQIKVIVQIMSSAGFGKHFFLLGGLTLPLTAQHQTPASMHAVQGSLRQARWLIQLRKHRGVNHACVMPGCFKASPAVIPSLFLLHKSFLEHQGSSTGGAGNKPQWERCHFTVQQRNIAGWQHSAPLL